LSFLLFRVNDSDFWRISSSDAYYKNTNTYSDRGTLAPSPYTPTLKIIHPHIPTKIKRRRAIEYYNTRPLESLTPTFVPVSQTNSTSAERGSVHCGHGRGLAQLSSRVPVGLQGGRDRRIPVEHDHAVARPVRRHRLGVRSQDAVQAARPAGGCQPRRRKLATGTGNGAHVGL